MKIIFHIGRYVSFLAGSVARPEKASMYLKELFRQMNNIGVESVPIVGIVSLFIGAVTAVQFVYQIRDFAIPLYYIGFIVRDSMIIEMAPTMTCMMLAGKVGSNIASELGNMRISEQIEALEIMGLSTRTYLVATKILATLLVVPALILIAAFVGIMGGWVASILSGVVTTSDYVQGLYAFYDPFNVKMMFIKGAVFAFILSSIACYEGFYVRGGAIQIGEASTRAVVNANILILVADFIIAKLLLT